MIVVKCMLRKWVAVPPIESLLIKGFHALQMQDKLPVSQYIQEFTEGKLMVLSTVRKATSTICKLVLTLVTTHVGKWQILVSVGSTTLGACGW